MKICAEVSLYPQKTTKASQIINNALEAIKTSDVEYEVGSMSTHLHGEEGAVWRSLMTMFNTADKEGEVSMVVTITNSAHN